MARGKKRYGAMADINVVPYIDVMLVLLIIFMVTAPMIMQGVQVELPHAKAKPVPPQEKDPLIVSIKANGTYYLKGIGTDEQARAATTLADITERVGKVLSANPEQKIFVWGDRNVPYGDVVELMAALQNVGAESVGLVTDDQPSKKP
ncbi:MAG TPA: protein TolR [Spongiibacteraceae bacterium]|nr:protein TolR [Spongiibacteraceae bacterium]